MDEHLAKGAIEPLTHGAYFYSDVFMVPKHTGGLQPILNVLSSLPITHAYQLLKMPTISQVWQLIQQGDYDFSLDLEGAFFAYSHFEISL